MIGQDFELLLGRVGHAPNVGRRVSRRRAGYVCGRRHFALDHPQAANHIRQAWRIINRAKYGVDLLLKKVHLLLQLVKLARRVCHVEEIKLAKWLLKS